MAIDKDGQPSVSQLRGMMWLTVLLTAVVVILLLTSKCGGQKRETAETHELAAAVEQFADSMVVAQRQEDSLYRSSWKRGGYENHGKAVDYGRQDTLRSRPIYQEREKVQLVFELNTADTLDLQQLRGIGPSYARRIVKYRQLLGGYVRVEQLREVYGMTEELYQQVAPHVTVDASRARKLAVNTATVDQLKRHPYLDYYQAKAIVNFRNSGVRFGGVEELSQVNLLDEETLRKIAPYIEY